MMARKLLVVATAPAWERYLWIRELRPGDIHRTRRVIIRPGGKGVHVALAATRLGLMPKVLGIVDPGTSRDFSGSLLREGIEAGFVAGEGLTRTCTCIVDERSGLMTEVDEPATAVSEAEWSQLLTHARSSCEEGAEVLAISGSLPKSVPPERVGELVRAASSVGVLTVLDTSGQALVAGLTAGPDWVKVNEHEARDVLGTSVKSSGTELAQGLQQRGGKNAVVTMGERGCVAVSRTARL